MPDENSHKKGFVPLVVGGGASEFRQAMQELTGNYPIAPTLPGTPPRQIMKNQHPVIATTPGGSKLLGSPSKLFEMTITSPDGKEKEKSRLYLLVRQQDYVPSSPSGVLNSLSKRLFSESETLSVTATPETINSKPERHTQKREREVVGDSAAHIVMNYLEKQGITFPRKVVIAEKWELCHLLSYAIAKNAIDENGKPFDTQIAINLFAGTRVFNENMMRIENVLLSLLNQNAVRAITYSATPIVLKEAHILAKLTLEICIETHEGAKVKLDMHYDALSESRKLPSEASTCFSAFFKGINKRYGAKKGSCSPESLTPT